MKNYYELKAGTPEIINCLVTECQWLNILKGRDKPYESVLDYLIGLGKIAGSDPDGEFDREMSKIKTIEEKTHISSAKIRNWIFKIYDDILEVNENEPALFAKEGHHHVLSFESTYGYYSFQIWLPYRLNLYDGFTFPFIKAKLHYDYFYVNNVSIDHCFGESIINARLQGGRSNIFREWIYDKAEFLGELSIYDRYNQTDYQIDAMLREYSRKGYISHSEPVRSNGRKK